MSTKWNNANRLGVMASVLVSALSTAAFADEATEERALTHQVTVSAPRAVVWKTLTTTEGVNTFFARHARVELRQGGAYEIYFDLSAEPGTRGSEGCKILSFVPEEMLSFTWNAPPKFSEIRGQRTYVVIQLSDGAEGKTIVRLTNGGYKTGGQWDGSYEYFKTAWEFVLKNLQARFDSGPRWPASEVHAMAPSKSQSYVYFLRPVREELIEEPTEFEREAIARHSRYLRDLLTKDKLVLAGRTREGSQFPKSADDATSLQLPAPGIVVFEAESLAEAKSILQNDPAVAAGVFKGFVNPFEIALLRQ